MVPTVKLVQIGANQLVELLSPLVLWEHCVPVVSLEKSTMGEIERSASMKQLMTPIKGRSIFRFIATLVLVLGSGAYGSLALASTYQGQLTSLALQTFFASASATNGQSSSSCIGSSPTSGCSLSEALSEAEASNTNTAIYLITNGDGAVPSLAPVDGYTGPSIDYNGNFSVDIPTGSTVTIENYNGNSPVLNGDFKGTVLTVTGTGTLNLSGVTITGGLGYSGQSGIGGTEGNGGNGGGISTTASLAITNSTISGNSAGAGVTNIVGTPGSGGNGGGISTTASLTITGSTISDNSAGGGANSSFGTGGSGGNGGGISTTASLTITNSTISGNSAGVGGTGVGDTGGSGGNGGGISTTASLTIIGSTISGNSAGTGGGGTNSGGNGGNGGGISTTAKLTLKNSTISGNSAGSGGNSGTDTGGTGGSGGGIYTTKFLTIIGSTISDNSAGTGGSGYTSGSVAGSGDGIYNNGGKVVLAGDLLATTGGTSSGDECTGGGFIDVGYNVSDDSSCFTSTANSVTSSTAEDLTSLGNYGGTTKTILPTLGNPAIGLIPAGKSVLVDNRSVQLCPTTDQRGFTTPTGVTCDAGSVQLASVLFAAAVPVGTGSCADVADACSLTTALGDVGAGGTIELVTPGSSASYDGNFTVDTTGTTVTSPVTIEPAPGVSDPTLDGTNSGTVMTNNSGTHLNLIGMSVTGGDGSASGGGIYNAGTLTVTGSTISDNTADSGLNTASGGGIYNAGTLTVTGSTISDNTARGHDYNVAYGGGIYNARTLTIANSTIAGNTSQGGQSVIGYGGGIYSSGVLDMTASTIADNTAVSGGNTASGDGIYNSRGKVYFAADLFATLNGAPSGGECAGYKGTFTDEGYNVSDDSTCGFTTSSTSTSVSSSSAAEDLTSLGNYGGPTETILPETGNPAIGLIPAGTSVTVNKQSVQLCPTTDQRGFATSSGVSCDAGSTQVLNQAITFTGPTTLSYGVSGTLSASGGSSGQPLVFSVASTSGTEVCNVSGTDGSTVNSTGIGTCVIDVNQAGNDDYLSAPQVQESLTVIRATPTPPAITNLPTGGIVGGGFTASVATSGDGTTSVTAGPASVCSARGLVVSYVGAGQCTLTPQVAQGTDYTSLSGEPQTITIQAPPVRVPPSTPTTQPSSSTPPPLTSPTSQLPIPFGLITANGGIFTHEDSSFSSKTGSGANDIVGGAASGTNGYWLVTKSGTVESFGTAHSYGSVTNPVGSVIGMAATPDDNGYWVVTNAGVIYNFGDAMRFVGVSIYGITGLTGTHPLNAPIVGLAPTPDGKGLYLVAADGGVFNFGDARFLGNTYTLGLTGLKGTHPLNAPIVGMTLTPSANGYLLIAADGGVFNLGDAKFLGNTYTLGITGLKGTHPLNAPIVGGTYVPGSQAGYYLFGADGGVFNFGTAPFEGSNANTHLGAPVIGEITL